MRRARRFWGVAVLGLLLAGITASCGDDGAGDTSPSGNTDAPAHAPQAGGTVTFGELSPTRGLDPTVSAGNGSTGGVALAAIYDVIVRYNPETREYEPRTAESLTSNDDGSVWTLKIRPDLTFGDGTSYDAAAVKSSIERHVAPASQSLARGHLSLIESMRVVDPLTLEFTLVGPWPGFPYALSMQGGMITSPTAVETQGEKFNLNPVGAGVGPFEVSEYRPNETIVLTKKADYYAGDVYLDELRFIRYEGSRLTLEALQKGEIEAAFMRDAVASKTAHEAGIPGYAELVGASDVLLINVGAQGVEVPTSDVRVRQAIGAAIDPDVIRERVYQGVAMTQTSPLPTGFPWQGDSTGFDYDPDHAKDLVAAAKADGWDGKIRLMTNNSPLLISWGQAIATMLELVGMEVDHSRDLDGGATYAKVLQGDYDLTYWAFAVPPTDGAFIQLQQNLRGPVMFSGFDGPLVNAAIDAIRAAGTDDEKTEAFEQFMEAFKEEVPAVPTTGLENHIVWTEKLHGIEPTSNGVVLFANAWLQK